MSILKSLPITHDDEQQSLSRSLSSLLQNAATLSISYLLRAQFCDYFLLCHSIGYLDKNFHYLLKMLSNSFFQVVRQVHRKKLLFNSSRQIAVFISFVIIFLFFQVFL